MTWGFEEHMAENYPYVLPQHCSWGLVQIQDFEEFEPWSKGAKFFGQSASFMMLCSSHESSKPYIETP